ncbi:hypothetical protein SSCI18S_00900 [Sphingobium scionense]
MREAFGHLSVEGRAILSRRVDLCIRNIATWGLMIRSDEPV